MRPARQDAFDCVVRDTNGAYVTSTVRGKRASSTVSAEAAVKSLAEKIFGRPPAIVRQIGVTKPAVWRAST